ncbi:MAG TPA: pyruvate kinase [Thermomicrobiaceae bacterium]|nr:pyruvate kinase [Thermomicrobiaceae bacterium]
MTTTPRTEQRNARIVATIGPASWELEALTRLLTAGVDVVRVNAAHNSVEERRGIVATIRRAAAEVGRPVAVLQDLAGPKPRTGPLADGVALTLARDQQLTLVAGDAPLQPDRISIDDEALVAGLEPGQRVLLSDGLLELHVGSCRGGEVLASVVRGGRLRGRQGVTVPGAPLPPRVISPQEAADIAFAAEQDLEYLGVSFVTAARDVTMVREELQRHGGRAGIIAKIERPEALSAIEEIARCADGLMVARGDLGVQLPPEEVPIAQKRIIQVARTHGTPVITATQMLESMTTQPLPTRAEASDVANAVLDGSDAVMLSAETATGAYPLEAVEMMVRIIRTVERNFAPTPLPETERPHTVASTIARAASDIARRSAVINLIAVFTRSGFSAREVARERPSVPIVALTNSRFVANQLELVWGVDPLVAEFAEDTEELIGQMAHRLVDDGCAKTGDHVLFVGSLRVFDEPGHTDVLHLRRL